MGNSDIQFVGGPVGHHGAYTFYKAFKYNKNGVWRIVTLSEFFFVKMWRDSDLLCIGELQLLWTDKNSEQVLSSLRLYFLPENTPEGRLDHGEDEVLAISEKVVIRLEDLITLITVEAEWTWGRLAKSEQDVKTVDENTDENNIPAKKPAGLSFTIHNNGLDYSDVEAERKNIENGKTLKDPHVVILSFPKYCRFRAMMKRLEGVEDIYLKYKIVNALGGFYVVHPNTRVLFCRDTFDYPELEGHELLCNHLAPKLKGRPRGRRKKRSVSPGSESNESESSLTTSTKVESKNIVPPESTANPIRRSTRCHENNENREFVRKLGAFMKSNRTPIGRIPSLGYKELNLHEFFTRVQKLGGYDCVTTNRLWKSIFDEMSGHQNSTSAATVIRRHYERFLLPYERHIHGEEYKPLPVSERRRLKYKRGSGSLSDAESSSDSSSVPSTSRKASVSEPVVAESKEHVKTEGKTSSLRSIRVKSDRQKDKQLQSEKDNANNNNNNEKWQSPIKTEQTNGSKAKVEKLVIKTESMTVKTELSTVITQSHPVKIEYATVKSETQNENAEIKIENKNIPVTISVKIETNLQAESTPVKLEECPSVKLENDPVSQEPDNSNVKVEVIPIKTEPLTSAATPVAMKVPVNEIMSPVEGKENIPIIKSTENNVEIIEVPCRPRVSESSRVENESYRNNFIHEIKKRKLDILKEGGLEVTPVRPAVQKDGRPSVIQPPPVQLIPKSIKSETMPPPTSVPLKRTHISVPPTLNISQIPTTPTKKSTGSSFSFVNGASPPKVVQSRSIYSYSEKTVYGNPKDILSPMVHAPKFVDTVSRHTGGDPVDLSVNSPQKPIVEIMRVPQTSSSSPYNRESVTKNLYKTSSIMDGRRLGPNLEITLVGPNNKTHPNNLQKMYNYPPHSTSQASLPQKRVPTNYYASSKPTKGDENGKFKSNGSHLHHRANMDLNLLMKQESAKPATSRQSQQNLKQFSNPTVPTFPPYLTQLYEQASKGISPYLPFMDPTMYYTAAMQNIYSSNNLNSAPILPMPTPEQLKLYAELMAHGRIPYPFQMPHDNNKLKKQ
ncbi:uncharacterized protein LOC114324733 [Diabrotica virgifera virgifera]|uniref:ARID domain-containing protein n=1 Tax=Diabrotica virgifera virgifera TaxID=50390 RepID=A0ABM5IA53_DIAVI|nr:uncharacterized protein LOC114324733 [Diabrotica virgifera virgifera]